ncbi:Two pore calcium channel protein 1B [Phytophthora nicotianae]|uniref:Two pore calcium channel protein 1B n=1 Tax=Phytophthora nicotianae TaxID=4792 RepID=A0A0W8CRM9_PHYNI|nr:Two pore calcium channel protein 1B [Phytophthora nicotianae]
MAAKTVLITGSNRGIGLAFAKHYKTEGWKVIGCARNVDAATELKQLEPWKLLTLDTSNEESVHAAAKTLENVPINLLINNAGVMDVHDLQSTTKADLLRHFEVNASGSGPSGGKHRLLAPTPGYVNTAMVGFQGTVFTDDSVKGLARIIANAKLEDSAKMFHFEKGEVLPW